MSFAPPLPPPHAAPTAASAKSPPPLPLPLSIFSAGFCFFLLGPLVVETASRELDIAIELTYRQRLIKLQLNRSYPLQCETLFPACATTPEARQKSMCSQWAQNRRWPLTVVLMQALAGPGRSLEINVHVSEVVSLRAADM